MKNFKKKHKTNYLFFGLASALFAASCARGNNKMGDSNSNNKFTIHLCDKKVQMHIRRTIKGNKTCDGRVVQYKRPHTGGIIYKNIVNTKYLANGDKLLTQDNKGNYNNFLYLGNTLFKYRDRTKSQKTKEMLDNNWSIKKFSFKYTTPNDTVSYYIDRFNSLLYIYIKNGNTTPLTQYNLMKNDNEEYNHDIKELKQHEKISIESLSGNYVSFDKLEAKKIILKCKICRLLIFILKLIKYICMFISITSLLKLCYYLGRYRAKIDTIDLINKKYKESNNPALNNLKLKYDKLITEEPTSLF